MKREFQVMAVTSDDVVRILGSLNMEEAESILDEMKFWRSISVLEIKSSQPRMSPSGDVVAEKLARISHRSGTDTETSARLYFDSDHANVDI